METIVRLIGRPVPVDDASIAGDFQERVGKEMLERAPSTMWYTPTTREIGPMAWLIFDDRKSRGCCMRFALSR